MNEFKTTEERRQKSRDYYAKNRERIIARQTVKYRKNRPQILERQRMRYANDPTWSWDQDYRKRYGITYARYVELLDGQDHRCAICQKHENELDMRLCVDHCHKTSRVRGLLCSNCNRALGLLADKIENAEKLIQYIKERV